MTADDTDVTVRPPAQASASDPAETQGIAENTQAVEEVRRFRFSVVDGPNRGLAWESSSDRCAIGTHDLNDLVLTDPTVSRFHCEVHLEGGVPRLRDIGSRNGTWVSGVRIVDCHLRGGTLVTVGRSVLQLELATTHNRLHVSEKHEFGTLVGRSVAMRSAFALLEKVAATDATVLIEGETGTGKEGAASSVHRASQRGNGPFVVVDCGAIPANLVESELFGHERGAFTGATERRKGAFEEANGGTLFLDEIGELPLELQPKLLRVLEGRQIRPVGASAYLPVDVRIVAATHRDLRLEVNEERFRPDLYYRLSVFRVTLPPLRQRPEDIPLLVERMLAQMDVDAKVAAAFREPAFYATLQRTSWPGNVRELRNHLERCAVFEQILPPPSGILSGEDEMVVDETLPLESARRRVLSVFERRYVTAVVRRHDGKVAEAARAAGVDRTYLWRLISRHKIKVKD